MASDGALLGSKGPYRLAIGIDLPRASFGVGCMTASSVVGKLGIDLAADRVGIRGVDPMRATLTGSAASGSVSGAMQLGLHPISIALLTIIDATHDRTGSYRLASQALIGLVCVATTLVFPIALPARRARGAREVPA
ncbi:MAG: hypothetical protein R3F35_04820 [Myxococcota bacterium]